MRVLALWFVVAALSAYAWRDWYTSLCGLIALTAVIEHPDMPRAILGFPGLNPWNLLFFTIVAARLLSGPSSSIVPNGTEPGQGHEKARWDMPRGPATLLLCGLALVAWGFIRVAVDREGLIEDMSTAGLLSEYAVNPVKWVAVGLLLFDGCRDRRRLTLGLIAILTFYVLMGLQVLRWVLPSGALNGGSLSAYTIGKLRTEVGHHRNDLSVMLAGGSWAVFAMQPLARSLGHRLAILAVGLTVLFSVVLTGGRGGYLAWATVGLTLGVLRWRRYLLVAPLVVILVSALVPSAVDRALEGIQGQSGDASQEIDIERLTAGRNVIWSTVIDKILASPIIGYGRAAMQRTGVSSSLVDVEGEELLDHPHNAYLEMLLDSGVIGLLVTLALHGVFVAAGVSLVRDPQRPELVAVGGVGLSLVIAQLVGSFSGQSFWPREATLGMWCAIGLLCRGLVQRAALAPPGQGAAAFQGTEWWRPGSAPREPAPSVGSVPGPRHALAPRPDYGRKA